MKHQGKDAYDRIVIVGKKIECNSQKGVILEDERGVRHFITNDRYIGPVPEYEEMTQGDLFGPIA